MKSLHLPWIVAWSIVLAGSVWSQARGAWWQRASGDGAVGLRWNETTTATPMLDGKPVVSYAAATSGSSAMSRITSGTRQAVSGAVDLITLKPLRNRLFAKKAEPPAWQSQAKPWNPQPEKKPSFLGSLFKPKEQPRGPTTVNEFIAQPKPQ